MDKKNLIAFLALSLAVLLVSNLLFPPPQPPKPKVGEKPAVAADAGAKPGEAAKVAAAPGEQPAAENAPLGQVPGAIALPPDVPEVPLEFVSLGSLDRDTGYRILLTLTNRGAAVRRAELSSPRFLDLTDRSGYLGHLEFENTAAGLKVRAVGAGTPAALARIEVGDVITHVQRAKGQPVAIKTIDEFEAVRTQTRDGQDFILTVVRGSDAPKQLNAKLVRRPLEVMRPEIDNILMRKGTVPADFVDPPSFLVGMASIGNENFPVDAAAQRAAWLKEGHAESDPKYQQLAAAAKFTELLQQGNWEVTSHDPTSVTFERLLPARSLKLIKRYTLEPVPAGSRQDQNFPGYNLKLDVEVQNTGIAKQSVAYRLDGPTGLPLEGWWYTHKISQRWFSAAGLRDVVMRFQNNAVLQVDCSQIAAEGAISFGQGTPLTFVGVDAVKPVNAPGPTATHTS